jgi:hypothetical protein
MTEDDTKPLDDYLNLSFPDNQQKAVDEARRQLEARGVDISDMPDRNGYDSPDCATGYYGKQGHDNQ